MNYTPPPYFIVVALLLRVFYAYFDERIARAEPCVGWTADAQEGKLAPISCREEGRGRPARDRDAGKKRRGGYHQLLVGQGSQWVSS